LRALGKALGLGAVFGFYFILTGVFLISPMPKRLLTSAAGSLLGWITYRLIGQTGD
jgi:hypothetical protein